MGTKCGIVGLPNVGKSTFFNASVGANIAEAANYPFCTIAPNIGSALVSDDRLGVLAKFAGSAKILATRIELVDIAGLVKGASKGAGLGNQFLGHIREVDVIVYLLRCFEDANVVHVNGKVDPVEDAEIIKTELVLADIESLDKRLPNLEKRAKSDDFAKEQLSLVRELIPILSDGKLARVLLTAANDQVMRSLQLLTDKPYFYVCNVAETDMFEGNAHTKGVAKLAASENVPHIIISAKIESEVAEIKDKEERMDFLRSLGLESSGLDNVVLSSYELLGLITFFTIGPKEAHAWPIKRGAKAPQAAGIIHSDFEKGFICAEVVSYDDYVACGGEQAAKDAGKMRKEGRDYVVNDGDVVHFRYNKTT